MKNKLNSLFGFGIIFMAILCISSKTNSQSLTINDSFMKMQSMIIGSGTPLVLVPGGLTGWVSWEPHAKILSPKKTIIRVQLLSVQWGLENRALPADYTIRTESESLANTIDSLGYTHPVDIVGWSFGAFTALQYSLDHPGRVRTLTLIEPPAMWVLRMNGKLDEATQKEADFFLSLKGDISEDMLGQFLKHAGFLKPGQSPTELPQWGRWVPFRHSLRNSFAVSDYTDDIKRLQDFQIPVLLVKGTGSSPWLHRVIDTLAKHLPHSRIIELPGAHAPHIVSMEKFLEELEKFQNNPDK